VQPRNEQIAKSELLVLVQSLIDTWHIELIISHFVMKMENSRDYYFSQN